MVDNLNESYDHLKKTVESLGSPVDKILQSIEDMANEADKLNVAFVGGRVRLDEMNDAAAKSAAGIIRLGGDIGDISKTISGIAEGSRRQVIATEDQVSKLYAATAILGGSAGTLVESFGSVGIEVFVDVCLTGVLVVEPVVTGVPDPDKTGLGAFEF